MTGEVAALVAVGPYHALQGFQRRHFLVGVDPVQQRGDYRFQRGVGVLHDITHGLDLLGHRRCLCVLAQKVRQLGVGIGEQHFVNEVDIGSGTFDIGHDSANGWLTHWDHRLSSSTQASKNSIASRWRRQLAMLSPTA